jgi:hypothetical protein
MPRDWIRRKPKERRYHRARSSSGAMWMPPPRDDVLPVPAAAQPQRTEQAGVPVKDAMLLVGHKTMAIYNRYSIGNKKRLLAGGAKLAQFFADHEAEAAEQKVVQLKTGTE